jgi:hypothetical protein
MSRGVDVALKNARGHTPLDLATDATTRSLIETAFATKVCKGRSCGGSKFDFKNIRYYCEQCTKFFCRLCSQQNWVYEHKDADSKERPICRCLNCQDKISKSENELREAMETQDYHTVHKVLSQILNDKMDIDVKL